jgi:hypothetical protein
VAEHPLLLGDTPDSFTGIEFGRKEEGARRQKMRVRKGGEREENKRMKKPN